MARFSRSIDARSSGSFVGPSGPEPVSLSFDYTGESDTFDISPYDTITIEEMHGADGGDASHPDGFATNGGSGGLIEGSTADISGRDELEIYVGQRGGDSDDDAAGLGGWGRSNGGDGGDGFNRNGAGGGGSTELIADGALIAASDAGGGGSATNDEYNFGSTGGGGARGGAAGNLSGSGTQGDDAEGDGFGGQGGATSEDEDLIAPGEPGGTELGIAEGGTLTEGGSEGPNGHITILLE